VPSFISPLICDLEAKCRGYAGDRKWEALAHCADQLKPPDPKRAVELATRAAGEARSAPRIVGVEAARYRSSLLEHLDNGVDGGRRRW
jgi:hypothetical protein